jgi:hypothetical protein
VIESMWTRPAFSSAPAREAAAPDWQTVSLMSLGASHMPAKNTPLVGASTGFSLGCDSMKNPSLVRESVSMRAILAKSCGGWTPTDSTTMSSSCRSTLPAVVFSTVTRRLPVAGSSSTPPGRPRT